jgi:hypothetical protein
MGEEDVHEADDREGEGVLDHPGADGAGAGDVPNPDNVDQPVAPYGYKKDGTPKKAIGRPVGARNKKKKHHNKKGYCNPGLAKSRVPFKPGNTHGPAVPAVRHTDYCKWREKLKTARTRFFTQTVFLELLEEARLIAMNREHPDQLSALTFLVEQCVGKASSKIDVDVNHEHGLSVDQKLEIFKAITGLTKPEVIESTATTGSSLGDPLHRDGVLGLPAPVDLRPEQDSGLSQAGEMRPDLRTFVVVDQAPDVPATERPADQRDIRLEESEDRSGVHGVSEEVGDGDRGAVARPD